MTVWDVDALGALTGFSARELRRLHVEHRDTSAGPVLFWLWQAARAREDSSSETRIAAQFEATFGSSGNGLFVDDDTLEYVKVSQAMTLLDCSDRNVRYLLRDRRLRGRKRHGAWRVERESIDELLEERGEV